jgi:serine protease Do
MQKFNLIKYIERLFGNKYFVSALLANFILTLAVLALGLGVAWQKRAEIFGYFAQEYLSDKNKNKQNEQIEQVESVEDVLTEELIDEVILEEQPFFPQERSVIDVVKETNPAVVSIIISKAESKQNATEKKQVGGGSGFFVTSDGLIVTNRHVVDRSGVVYTVFTNDGEKHVATVVALDPVLDIALIKISGSNFPSLTLGDSDALEVGQSVIAIGNALAEFRNTVSLGVISGLARSITAGDSSGRTEVLDLVIQTDAAINPGNSGGPLLDLFGRVVGVNVAAARGSQSIGFALPINSVKGAIESVKSIGKIVRPYLGIRYLAINKVVQEKNNLSVDYGVLVIPGADSGELAVIPGSPADKAGIVENDIILEIDGVKLGDKTNLASIIRQKKIGQVVNLKILSKGFEKNVKVTMALALE